MKTLRQYRRCSLALAVTCALCGVWVGPRALAADAPATPPATGVPAALDRADTAWSSCLRLLGALAGPAAPRPPPIEEMTAALAAVRREVTDSQNASCLAFVKMASYTAWLIHIESRKIPASLRLIQMTRSTGRTEEVERYEQRHATLLQNIEAAAHQYALALSELGKLPSPLVDTTFSQYEVQLVELGLPEQIRLNQIVRAHLAEYAGTGQLVLGEWKEELEQLLPPNGSGEKPPEPGE